MMTRKWMWIAPIAIVGVLVVCAIGGGVVMFLWNWLMPSLFGRPEVTFPQAFGLLVLCRILFGGGTRHGFQRRSWGTAEDKARFRQRIRERLGLGPSDVKA